LLFIALVGNAIMYNILHLEPYFFDQRKNTLNCLIFSEYCQQRPEAALNTFMGNNARDYRVSFALLEDQSRHVFGRQDAFDRVSSIQMMPVCVRLRSASQKSMSDSSTIGIVACCDKFDKKTKGL